MFLCGEGKKRSDKPLLVVWHGGGLVESVAGESTSDKGFSRSIIAWLVSWGKGNNCGGESPSQEAGWLNDGWMPLPPFAEPFFPVSTLNNNDTATR